MLKMPKYSAVRALVSLLALFHAPLAWADEIEVWEYHSTAPFVIDADTEQGLSYDLARLLTKNSGGRHIFSVELLPRLRLDKRLQEGLPGVVFWANNHWFADPDKSKFRWSSPILSGKNLVLSPASNPVEYVDARSIANMDLIGVRGHVYSGVDERLAELNIRRKDVSTEEAAIEFISVKPDGALIISNLAASYFLKDLQLKNKIHVSKLPHATYDRYVLVQPDLGSAYQTIEAYVSGLASDPEWAQILAKYGL